MTKEGNPRLLLGGKQADDLGNFCAVYNWGLFTTLSISGAQVCGNRSSPGLGCCAWGRGVDSGLLGEGGPWMCWFPATLTPQLGGRFWDWRWGGCVFHHRVCPLDITWTCCAPALVTFDLSPSSNFCLLPSPPPPLPTLSQLT